MSRRHDFLMLVQTRVLAALQLASYGADWAVDAFDAATEVPEDAIPIKVREAAREFADRWPAKPAWLLEYEEGQRNSVLVRIAEPLALHRNWALGVEALGIEDAPRSVRRLLAGSTELRAIVVSRADAEEIRAWMLTIPGGDLGPLEFVEQTQYGAASSGP